HPACRHNVLNQGLCRYLIAGQIWTLQLLPAKPRQARQQQADQHNDKDAALHGVAVLLALVEEGFRLHFPIQKLEKISPSRSSLVNCPVMAPSASCARRSSSANKSST